MTRIQVANRNFHASNERFARGVSPLVDTGPVDKVPREMPKTKCSHGVWRCIFDPEGFASNCTVCQSRRAWDEAHRDLPDTDMEEFVVPANNLASEGAV